MLSGQISKRFSPIIVKQSTLHKYFPFLPEPNTEGNYVRKYEILKENKMKSKYTLIVEPGNRIEIEETHCLECGRRLLKNRFNQRIIILDKGSGKYTFKVHRRRCPYCGEIKIDLSRLAPGYGNYHENYKRRSRQLYMEGLYPEQIHKAFEILYDFWIPRTTIVTWVNSIQDELNQFMIETPVPSSGYWGYDEIFLRISKKKWYALTSIDVITKFAISVKVTAGLDRGTGVLYLREAKRKNAMPLKVIVKDGGLIFGNLFSTRNYNNVKVQLCRVHMKWLMNRYIKKFAGMSIQPKKPLPDHCLPIQDKFYRIIDSHDVTDTFIALEALRTIIERLGNSHLKRGLTRLEGQISRLINHQRDPLIPTTNNLAENFNQSLQKYPNVKRKMKSPKGSQRVFNYECFNHNMKQFLPYKFKLDQKYRHWRMIMQETNVVRWLKHQGNYFAAKYKRLNRSYNKYLTFWNNNIEILRPIPLSD